MTHNTIRMTPRVYADYKNTIARHPPETAAILGGRLENPGLITGFKFCPPEKRDGEYQSASTYVSVDADLMNWTILNEWQPNGKYALGFWHSHPGNVTSPSGMGGDLGLFEKCLQSDDAKAMDWDTLLAPITTFDTNGKDTIHGWTYKRGARRAEKVPVYIHYQGRDYNPRDFEALVANGAPQTTAHAYPRIRNAENLIRELALASTRLHATRGLSLLERLRLMSRFNMFAASELNTFLRGMNTESDSQTHQTERNEQ